MGYEYFPLAQGVADEDVQDEPAGHCLHEVWAVES